MREKTFKQNTEASANKTDEMSYHWIKLHTTPNQLCSTLTCYLETDRRYSLLSKPAYEQEWQHTYLFTKTISCENIYKVLGLKLLSNVIYLKSHKGSLRMKAYNIGPSFLLSAGGEAKTKIKKLCIQMYNQKVEGMQNDKLDYHWKVH